ncbi:hypothetical protein BG004_002393 [Podila humilis]|nr:hypothetical protein BG004_002393 [Podila humilis]
MLPSGVSHIKSSSIFYTSRHVTKSIYAVAKPEGIGATVRRSFPALGFRAHDPFLALDDFAVNSKGGFPDHPHRGFETVTYLFKGRMQHQDFSGHKGTIGPGDLQWMTAGRGVVHCEMPLAAAEAEQGVSQQPQVDESKDGLDEGVMTHGLQLWVNLSKRDKTCAPAYQDLKDSVIPRVNPTEGVEIKVIAGISHGIESKVYTRTPTTYLDIRMDKNKTVDQVIPRDYAGFVYMVSGTAYFGDKKKDDETNSIRSTNDKDDSANKTGNSNIKINNRVHEPFQGTEHHSLILSLSSSMDEDQENEDTIHIETKEDGPAHFILFAGQPTGEQMVRSDLFVMNSKQEVQQALEDYREGKNGFENAKTWKSTIAPRGYRLKF